MNTSKNMAAVLVGNLLASFCFLTGASLLYAIGGGYEALSYAGFLSFIIFWPLVVGTIIFTIVFGFWVDNDKKESVRVGFFAFITHLISLILTLTILNMMKIGGLPGVFGVWLISHIIISLGLRLLNSGVLRSFGLKTQTALKLAALILVVVGATAYYAENLSQKNKANEVPLPTMACSNDKDCSALDCTGRGHRFYCDSNGFPRCSQGNVCSCSFGCL